MEATQQDIVSKAKHYAIGMHSITNHKYDGHPYSMHLKMVYDIALDNIHEIPMWDRDTVLAGCWVHDVIEDCRQTYNDVKAATNEAVAELAYALTNEKGKTRKDRANDAYYKGIRETTHATFIKMCDRLANYKYSLEHGKDSGMAKKYEEEMLEFIIKVDAERYPDLLTQLCTVN